MCWCAVKKLLTPSFPSWFRGLGCFGSLVFCLWTSAAASECICAALHLRIELFWTSTNCTMMITDDDSYFWTLLLLPLMTFFLYCRWWSDDVTLLLLTMCWWWFYFAAPINDRKSLMCWSDCLSTSPATCWCISLLPIMDNYSYYSWTCLSLPSMDNDYPSLSTTPMMDFSRLKPLRALWARWTVREFLSGH